MTRLGTLVSVTESPSITDVYGDPVEIEVETSVRYELQQLRRDEEGPPDNWQIGAWRLYLPPATIVSGVDRFVDDNGDVYELDGPPAYKRNPRTSKLIHIEATVRRVT